MRPITDSRYNQVIMRYLGPEAYRLLGPQLEDVTERLVWSDTLSLWSLPMVFFVEIERSPPTTLRIWTGDSSTG